MFAAGALAMACAGYHESSAGGEVISASDAAKTVVLNARNLGTSPVLLQTLEDGRMVVIGSVPAQDSASFLLDPTLFPTARLFIRASAQAGYQRVAVGPLAAGKGDQIDLTLQEGLTGSQANVRR